MGIQVLTNVAVKAYQVYLPIRRSIPRVRALLRKIWKKLLAILEKMGAKAPVECGDGKLEQKQVEGQGQQEPEQAKAPSPSELPSDQTYPPQVEEAKMRAVMA